MTNAMAPNIHVATLLSVMESRLLELLEQHPIETNTAMGLAAWQVNYFDFDDYESMGVIIDQMGEAVADMWFAGVLTKAGYVSNEPVKLHSAANL